MTLDNPNKKGTLGEIAVCKELLQLGYNVFTELGNHSKIDLIVLDENYKPYKIQVKTANSKNECVEVYSIKNCLNRNIIRHTQPSRLIFCRLCN